MWLIAGGLLTTAAAGEGEAIGVCGYRALLFGVETYADPDLDDLSTPHEDVTAIGRVLEERFGVQAETVLDPDRRGMLDALDALRSEVRDCEAVVLYFAGHGVYDEAADEGYWLPSDADDASRATWISNADIASGVNALPARHVLLVSDSCFAGSLFTTRGLSRAEPAIDGTTAAATKLARERSRWVVTSGGDEPVEDEYREGLSVFAYFLRQSLATVEAPYVTLDELFPDLRSLVTTNADQTPRQGAFRGTGHEGGQLVFVNARAPVSDGPVAVPADVPLRDDPRPPAPTWWVPGIALALGAFGVGGLVWLRTRRRVEPPRSPAFTAFRQQTYQGLWNRVERLHTDLRREAVAVEAVAERVADINAFVIERGVHIEPEDAGLVERYLRALVALKAASGQAGPAAEADLATTGAFDRSILEAAPELARLDEEVRTLRDQLRTKVQSMYA